MKKILFLAPILAFIAWPTSSYAADWGHHGGHAYYHYHDHPHWGVHVHAFYPNEYYPVWVGGAQYYYDDGIYYNYTGGAYVVAQPPVGAVVGTIPSDFQPTVVNGVTYYVDNGVYYVSTPNGYKVVTGPVQNMFTVNVPRQQGGYVAVSLKKNGNGFVGPQGEFYANFPSVSQLQTMYGR